VRGAGAGVMRTRTRTLWFGWMLAVLAMAGFCTLGGWQMHRMRLKQAMLDAVGAVLEQRAAAPLVLAQTRTQGYDWTRGTGRFADAPAVLLDNQVRNGRAGVRAYRVFLPAADPHRADLAPLPLLVELGWLPLDDRRALPEIPRPQGVQWLEGLLAPPPATGIVKAPAVLEANGEIVTISLAAANLPELLHQPRLAARVLRPDPALPLGYARDFDVLPNTLPPERHLGYAIQWYALALAVLVTAILLTFRAFRR